MLLFANLIVYNVTMEIICPYDTLSFLYKCVYLYRNICTIFVDPYYIPFIILNITYLNLR